MALIVADRVKETTNTTGTGTLSLAGVVAGFQSFVAGVGTTNTTYYAITDSATGDWEVGIGTVTSGSPDTLSRDTVLESSNSDNLVNFGAGQKLVICTQPAEKAVYLDASDQLVIDGTSVTATATELNYVDGVTSAIQTQLDAKVAKAGDTMTGFLTLHAGPTNASHAATKEYVDTIAAASLHYHDPVRVESPVALTATYNNGTSGVGATLTNAGTQAALVIDGITLLLNDRVLIFHQVNAFENGVYFVSNVGSGSTNWVLTRSTDTDSYGASDPDALGLGDAFYVLEGDTGAGQLYVMNTEGAITIGTTGITFAEISSAQIYVGGSGIEISGTTISHSDTSSQASVNNSNGTVIQDVTLDTFGHVTALGSADLDGRYYTETEIDSTVSGLNSAIALKQAAATALTTTTEFGGDVSGKYNAIVVANDSHTHDTRYYTETETGSFFAGTTAITGYNKTNWDTAHGWGNHASAGYFTGPNLLPATDNTGEVGNTTFTWANGQFTDLTVNSVLSVRAAIDLADDDILRFGNGDDMEIYHTPSVNRIDLNNGDLLIRDDGTLLDPIRFTFGRTTGNFTATGVVAAPTVDTTALEVTNLKAKDGTSAGSIADSTGVVTLASSVLTTADINGGTIDNATIATSNITVGSFKTLDVSAGTLTLANDQISGDKIQGGTIGSTTITTLASTTGNITTVNATTVDTTNLEVTNVKAKDGTASATIADSTGVMTIASSVLTTTDINGGTIDGVTIGGASAGAGTFTTLAATTKSFLVDHPTKPDMKLRYACLEGPENGVYVRGCLTGSNVIKLPDYWLGLVHEDSITVSLTPVGRQQDLYVVGIHSNEVYVGGENVDCFYVVYGERKDVEKLVVEF